MHSILPDTLDDAVVLFGAALLVITDRNKQEITIVFMKHLAVTPFSDLVEGGPVACAFLVFNRADKFIFRIEPFVGIFNQTCLVDIYFRFCIFLK